MRSSKSGVIPEGLKKVYRLSNGGYPSRQYHVDDDHEIWFQRMLPIESVPLPEDEMGLIETMTKLQQDNAIPEEWIAFGMDPGANLLACQTSKDGVWYMPMDEWDQTQTIAHNWELSCKYLRQASKPFLTVCMRNFDPINGLIREKATVRYRRELDYDPGRRGRGPCEDRFSVSVFC